MWIGIDFGTSYSAAAAVVDGQLVHIRFDGLKQFRTAAYFARDEADETQFELTPAVEAEIEVLVAAGRRQQQAQAREQLLREAQARRSNTTVAPRPGPALRTETALREDAIRALRSQWLQQQRNVEQSARSARTDAVFGEPAIDAYLEDPRGQLVQSPKSMLGYRLFPGVAEVLAQIIARILRHMRLTASAQLGQPVFGVVLGRPVNFKSSMPEGNAQACAMLERAARDAGFTEVRFMLEPEAAALDYHRSTPERRTVLVLDIGGGTTDLCLAQVGGKLAFEPLANWGTGVGGAEVDLWLNLLNFMPHFGRGQVQVSGACFSEAAMVGDVVRQATFRGYEFKHCDEPYRSRLRLLQADGSTVRVARAVERLKIHLSTHARGSQSLAFVEPGLQVDAERADLTAAANYFLVHTGALLDLVAAQLEQAPAWVVLTGGASAAPYVSAEVLARFPHAQIARSDPSLGVVSGLAWAAADRLLAGISRPA